jgi:biopolymer transport protein ExbB
VAEIESNMERAANIEVALMEKKLGVLGLIAGIAPTLGLLEQFQGLLKFSTVFL